MSSFQKIDIASSTILRLIVMLLVLWVLYLIRDLLVMLLAAIIISAAIEPMARRLRQYRIPRALSVVLVYIAVLAILALAVTLIVPAFAEQSAQLARSLPQVLVGLEARFGTALIPAEEQVVPQLQDALSRFGANIGNISLNIFRQTADVFSGIFSMLFVLIIAFYLVIEEDALKKFFRLIIPRDHVPYVEQIVGRVQTKLGRWVLAQLALALIIGIVVSIGLWLLGVPHAFALGLIAGVLEIIPVIGPMIAGFLGVLVALSLGFLPGIGTLIFYILVQQLENHVLVPNIMKKATGLNPLVTILAVLLGGRLAGVAGVILSVPVATMISIFLSDFVTSADRDDELAG